MRDRQPPLGDIAPHVSPFACPPSMIYNHPDLNTPWGKGKVKRRMGKTRLAVSLALVELAERQKHSRPGADGYCCWVFSRDIEDVSCCGYQSVHQSLLWFQEIGAVQVVKPDLERSHERTFIQFNWRRQGEKPSKSHPHPLRSAQDPLRTAQGPLRTVEGGAQLAQDPLRSAQAPIEEGNSSKGEKEENVPSKAAAAKAPRPHTGPSRDETGRDGFTLVGKEVEGSQSRLGRARQLLLGLHVQHIYPFPERGKVQIRGADSVINDQEQYAAIVTPEVEADLAELEPEILQILEEQNRVSPSLKGSQIDDRYPIEGLRQLFLAGAAPAEIAAYAANRYKDHNQETLDCFTEVAARIGADFFVGTCEVADERWVKIKAHFISKRFGRELATLNGKSGKQAV